MKQSLSNKQKKFECLLTRPTIVIIREKENEKKAFGFRQNSQFATEDMAILFCYASSKIKF